MSHLESRKKMIERAGSVAQDVLIIGGGIHGACLARELTLRGYNVVLLEAHQFSYLLF